MTRFGIGIITTQDRDLGPEYVNLVDQSTTICVEVDSERTGVSKTRNRVIKRLYDSGCDYIALFDDDCFPFQRGWQTFLENAYLSSGSHVLVMPKDEYITHDCINGVEHVEWGIGAFTFMTRHAIETIGYFNTAYDTYGYEDVGYLFRARRAGITSSTSHDSAPVDISKYLYSIDCDPLRQPDNATMLPELKQKYIQVNEPIFQAEISSPENYYPFVG